MFPPKLGGFSHNSDSESTHALPSIDDKSYMCALHADPANFVEMADTAQRIWQFFDRKSDVVWVGGCVVGWVSAWVRVGGCSDWVSMML